MPFSSGISISRKMISNLTFALKSSCPLLNPATHTSRLISLKYCWIIVNNLRRTCFSSSHTAIFIILYASYLLYHFILHLQSYNKKRILSADSFLTIPYIFLQSIFQKTTLPSELSRNRQFQPQPLCLRRIQFQR